MKVTIGILAHVDAGKTTFCEELLYETKQIDKLGRVDHQDSFMDNHPIEKARGITIFSDQALITYEGHEIYLVDTPGHVDFSTEMERTIKILDYAILIISGVEGVESHTETVFSLLQAHQVPTYIFINKMDRDVADINKVMAEIHSNLSENVFNFTDQYKQGKYGEELRAWLGERSEILLDYYLDEKTDFNLWHKQCKKLIGEGEVIPCFSGTALYQEGIMTFFKFIVDTAVTNYNNLQPFCGKVYKISYDAKGLRWTYIKVIKGCVAVKDAFDFDTIDGQVTEKINEIKIVQGRQMIDVNQAEAGSLVAVSGLSHIKIGQSIGRDIQTDDYTLVPTLQARVIIGEDENKKWFYEQFKKLEEEDPTLGVKWQQEIGEIIIQIMGEIQLEVLKKTFAERFSKDVDFSEPNIIYKETISSKVYGYGHFEPLKHYAEVHLKLEPNPRNIGITFESTCHTDNLNYGNQNLIKTHIFEKEYRSILTGSGLTDVKVTLLTGRSHEKHTHGGDFREATVRALRQGLEQAKIVLLEPYYQFVIRANKDYLGKIMTNIQKANGTFDDPEIDENRFSLTGTVPVSTFMNYSTKLAAMTSGTGSIRLSTHGYDICHNTEEVIERLQYDKVTDKAHPSSSVFCTKGKGYTVAWEEAKTAMHCEIKEG